MSKRKEKLLKQKYRIIEETTAWIICYIDIAKLNSMSRINDFPKYRRVEVYIPTVRILTKKFKNKNHYEEVPLLFNYGFFRVPNYFIYNPHFLDQMKKDLDFIYGWVRDPAKVIHDKPILKVSKGSTYENYDNIATASTDEIAKLLMMQEEKSIYSYTDLKDMHPGKIIVLKGYPFDNVMASIVSINHSKEEVEVKLHLDTAMTQVKVSFENVFYTVYKSHNLVDGMKETSIETLKDRKANIDSLLARIYNNGIR